MPWVRLFRHRTGSHIGNYDFNSSLVYIRNYSHKENPDKDVGVSSSLAGCQIEERFFLDFY